MRKKENIGLYLSGAQVPVKGCGLFITQPTARQIVQYGESQFFQAVSMLVHYDEFVRAAKKGNTQLELMEDFNIFMVIVQQQKEIKKSIDDLFRFLFPEMIASYEQNYIAFRTQDDAGSIKGMLNMNNFKELQDTFSDLFVSEQTASEEFNPSNEFARRIAEKLQAARDKKKKANGGAQQVDSMIAIFTSTVAVGLGLSINSVYDMTLFQLYDIHTRYWNKTAYDLYQKIATTPMMDVSKMEQPEHWGGSIYTKTDLMSSGMDTKRDYTVYAK